MHATAAPLLATRGNGGDMIRRSNSVPAAEGQAKVTEGVPALRTSTNDPALIEFVRSVGLKDDVAALLSSNEITKDMLINVMEKVGRCFSPTHYLFMAFFQRQDDLKEVAGLSLGARCVLWNEIKRFEVASCIFFPFCLPWIYFCFIVAGREVWSSKKEFFNQKIK
jgi:hypothetical protein